MKKYGIQMENGNKATMTYDEVCEALHISPRIRFVKVTTRGTITFTAGNPDEIRSLKRGCREAGFKMAKSLVDCR